mmetsp:Transcript_19257/g.30618  ORF Transcript_19257/g.30618 Transcript_19257/m.30618 type:complete len:378 (-) Transcript_19257:115-1248(-)
MVNSYRLLAASHSTIRFSKNTELPKNVSLPFKIFAGISLILNVAAIVGTVVTMERRVNAIRHGANIVVIIFVVVIMESSLIRFLREIRVHLNRSKPDDFKSKSCDTDDKPKTGGGGAGHTQPSQADLDTSLDLQASLDNLRKEINKGSTINGSIATLGFESKQCQLKNTKIKLPSKIVHRRRKSSMEITHKKLKVSERNMKWVVCILPLVSMFALGALCANVGVQLSEGGSYPDDINREANYYNMPVDLVLYIMIGMLMFCQWYAYTPLPEWTNSCVEIFRLQFSRYFPCRSGKSKISSESTKTPSGDAVSKSKNTPAAFPNIQRMMQVVVATETHQNHYQHNCSNNGSRRPSSTVLDKRWKGSSTDSGSHRRAVEE